MSYICLLGHGLMCLFMAASCINYPVVVALDGCEADIRNADTANTCTSIAVSGSWDQLNKAAHSHSNLVPLSACHAEPHVLLVDWLFINWPSTNIEQTYRSMIYNYKRVLPA